MSLEFVNGISLMQGDCLERMKEIPDGSVDMILADLPYGTTACEWDARIPFEPLWEQYKRVIKDNGVVVLFGSEPFSTMLRMSNIKYYKYDWIWNKIRGVGHLMAKRRPMMCTENILVFYRKQPTYNPQMRKREKPRRSYNRGRNNVWGGDRKAYDRKTLTKKYPINMLTFSKSGLSANELHPAQKPVALLEYLIKTYTNEGETVLDNVMGSGSTGVAAVNTGRKFIGIELDEKFFETAKHRIAEALNARMAEEIKEKNKENEAAPEAGF